MAVCRICKAEFKASDNSGERICHRRECWSEAWDRAVAPFRTQKTALRRNYQHDYKGETAKDKIPRRYHQTTPHEKERIIKLFKSGMTRKQISEEKDIQASYVTICRLIERYQEEMTAEDGKKYQVSSI